MSKGARKTPKKPETPAREASQEARPTQKSGGPSLLSCTPSHHSLAHCASEHDSLWPSFLSVSSLWSDSSLASVVLLPLIAYYGYRFMSGNSTQQVNKLFQMMSKGMAGSENVDKFDTVRRSGCGGVCFLSLRDLLCTCVWIDTPADSHTSSLSAGFH